MNRFSDICFKEVVRLDDGAMMGRIGDAEIENGRIRAVVLSGRLRLFGLLGREPEKTIPWELVKKIGKDVIFVKFSGI